MHNNNRNFLIKLSVIRKILEKRGLSDQRTMAWRATGANNEQFIDELKEYGIIKSDKILETMKATDRKLYCRVANPYVDRPYSIGFSATISAPHMHCHALNILKDNLGPNARVLDVGSGSGFLTACFYRYMDLKSSDSNGMVIGIEHHPKLVEFSIENIKTDDQSMLDSGKLKIIQGDGREGCKEYAPYDAIHVGAAAAEIPDKLLEQLKNGGRMICPVGPEGETQQLVQYDKTADGEITKKVLMAVVYVPLTDLDAYK